MSCLIKSADDLGLPLGLISLATPRFQTDEQGTILVKTKTVLETGEPLLGGASILAILADVETESGISWESLSMHSCEHWALSVDVIVDLNG